MKMNSKVQLIHEDGQFRFVDNEEQDLRSRKVKRVFDRYQAYFNDIDRMVLSTGLTYVELNELIDKVNTKIDSFVELDEEVRGFISQSRYAIQEQQIAGVTIKNYDDRWTKEINRFEMIVNQEISRPLKEQQVQASFYMAMMKKAANFSVPGAGKTAMMYGAFAYLSSPELCEVNRLLVISPLNAFEAWRSEFIEVFGEKRQLNFINVKKYDNPGDLRTDWGMANVIVLNYEALSGWKLNTLNSLIDEHTMIVFDEVHRIKNPEGKWARNALTLGKQARYHYVLTGTPIPNSYKDIYNFLHLLYGTEYNSFFGWSVSDLDESRALEINEKLQPFFWRTNKEDLNVPAADPDQIIKVNPSHDQKMIVDTIYSVETNVLGKYIRLLQASTYPPLLTEKINVKELGFLKDEIDFNVESSFNSFEKDVAKKNAYLNLNVENIKTPKFKKGIELIRQLVSEGKKVLVWGMFVGTMKAIQRELQSNDISTHLIYGETPKENRVDLINDFRNGNAQVLISNPATLGESISLHQTVHDAVYFEYNFNLTFMLQSRDRIHRLGLPSNQYTRYYYLMTDGDSAHQSFIDSQVYKRLKEKELVMMHAVEGDYLLPEVSDNYLEDIKQILVN